MYTHYIDVWKPGCKVVNFSCSINIYTITPTQSMMLRIHESWAYVSFLFIHRDILHGWYLRRTFVVPSMKSNSLFLLSAYDFYPLWDVFRTSPNELNLVLWVMYQIWTKEPPLPWQSFIRCHPNTGLVTLIVSKLSERQMFVQWLKHDRNVMDTHVVLRVYSRLDIFQIH